MDIRRGFALRPHKVMDKMIVNEVIQLFSRKRSAKAASTTCLPDDANTQAQSRVSKLISPEGGWQALGYDEDYNYVILSLKTGQCRRLRPSDLTPKTIRAVVGAAFCEKQYRKVDPQTQEWVVDYHALSEAIVRECDAKGPISLEGVRSTGFYRDGDELFVNFGREVRTAEGKDVDVNPTAHCTYVAGTPLDVLPVTPCATSDDVRTIQDVLGTFVFANDAELRLVLGWVASRAFGRAAQVHPLLILDAEHEAGKTTLVGFLCALLGAQALRREGVPAIAQILRGLEDWERALFCDELEAKSGGNRDFRALEELTRGSFTTCEQARITRVIGGRLRVFNTPSGVVYAGVGTPALTPATESRAIRIRLKKPEDGERTTLPQPLKPGSRHELLALGQRFRKLLLSRWSVMRDAQAVLCDRLLALKHSERTAEKYAVVLAGYLTATAGAVPTPADADVLIREVGLERTEVLVSERDYDVCLRILLSSRISVHGDAAGGRKFQLTVADAVRGIILGPEAERRSLWTQLQEHGVRVDFMGAWKLTVSGFAQHARLAAIFRQSNYPSGAWKEVLLRRPGAEETVQRFGRGEPVQRAVRFDVPEYVLCPDDEGESLQAL